MKTMERLLQQLGFEELQSTIYSEIYFKGPSTVLELAAATGIKRPTVHFHVEKMIEKGVLKNAVKAGKRVLVAEPPELFVSLVEDQKRRAEQSEKSLEKMLAEMSALSSSSANNGLSVHCEVGVDAVRQLLVRAFEYGEVYMYSDYSKSAQLQKVKEELLFDTKTRNLLDVYSEIFLEDAAGNEFRKKAGVFKNISIASTHLRMQSNLAMLFVYESKIVTVRMFDDWQVLIVDQPILADFLKAMIAG